MLAVTCVVGFVGLVEAGDESPAQAGEKLGIEGTFVRVAENEEGWVVVGYRTANESVGKEWMLIDLGLALQKGQKSQTITRDHIKLVTPDKQVISMATQSDVEKATGELSAMVRKDQMMPDSINYFPPSATRPCRLSFFMDLSNPTMRGMAYDQVSLNPSSACRGMVFFHVPEGIKLGNYNVDVKFANSVLKVPVEIMTKEQAKEFEKKWKEAEKAAKHKHK
jgi:hypothetical protein